MDWAVTVAAIIQRKDRFLVVEETDGVHPERCFNQPAGHVDPGEGPLEALVREVREEAGLPFTPETVVGLYPIQARNGRDYFRIAIAGSVPEGQEACPEDPQILACHWLTREEIAVRPRSGAVLACLDDWLAGKHYPLELLKAVARER